MLIGMLCSFQDLTIALFVLGWNLLGDAIRDVFDPKMRENREKLVETVGPEDRLLYVRRGRTSLKRCKYICAEGRDLWSCRRVRMRQECDCSLHHADRSVSWKDYRGKDTFALQRFVQRESVDILKRSESFMQSIRGNDISMIFQEASTSLNPVFSIGEQIGESFFFHRLPEMLEKAIARLMKRFRRCISSKRGFKKMSRLFSKELVARYGMTMLSVNWTTGCTRLQSGQIANL